MKAQNIKNDTINNGISADFLLSNEKTLTLYLSWNNNEGEKWSFDVLINLLNRNDFEYQTSHFQKRSLLEASDYLETNIETSEINSIYDFIMEQKTALTPSTSSCENYYGI